MSIKVPLEKIRPNPYQPESRLKIDEETAKRFGFSILEHGLIQTPVVRQHFEDTELYYEIGDGWLRYQGFLYLHNNGHPEYTHLPVEERELTNQQMADMMLEANTIRKDLNPIEEALSFQRYIEEFKVSETALAKKHNLTQGAVANTIRLLQLPQDIQEKIKTGEIPATHARQLLRMTKAPKMQADMAKRCMQENWTVNRLSDSIERELWNNSKSLNLKSERWNKPEFDVSECKGCDFQTQASEPWGNQKKEARCLNEECWEKKNAAAVQTKAKAAMEELKKEGVKEKILTDKDVNYNQRSSLTKNDLEHLDSPQECKKCEKTALFKYRLTDERKPERICLDPACYKKKKTKKTKDTNKVKKEQDRELTVKLGETFHHVDESPHNCMIVIARHVLPMVDAAGRMDLAATFDLPKLSNGRLDIDALKTKLPSMSLKELTQLTVAAIFTRARRASAYGNFSTCLNDELRCDYATLTGTMEQYLAEINSFQEKNCRGCGYADEAKIGSGNECCINNAWAKKVGEDGKCRGRREPEKKQTGLIGVNDEGGSRVKLDEEEMEE